MSNSNPQVCQKCLSTDVVVSVNQNAYCVDHEHSARESAYTALSVEQRISEVDKVIAQLDKAFKDHLVTGRTLLDMIDYQTALRAAMVDFLLSEMVDNAAPTVPEYTSADWERDNKCNQERNAMLNSSQPLTVDQEEAYLAEAIEQYYDGREELAQDEAGNWLF